MQAPKIVAAVLSLTVLVVGVAVGVFLLRNSQTYFNRAAVPTGAGRVWLEPRGGELMKGERQKVDIYFTTGEGDSAHLISAISLRLVLNTDSILKLVGENEDFTGLIINPDLLLSGLWAIPVNEFLQDGQNMIIELGAVHTSITGYKAGSPQKLASFYIEAQEEGTATFAFDSEESHMFSKADYSEDILQNPDAVSFRVVVDNRGPEAVDDLRIVDFSLDSITLNWTSPVDQGPTGWSQVSMVVSNTVPITEQNWDSSQVLGGHQSYPAGTTEAFTFTGSFNRNTTYYFALKTYDDYDNYSDISNVVSATPTAPDSTLDFSFMLQGIKADKGLSRQASADFTLASGDTFNYPINVVQSGVSFKPAVPILVNDVVPGTPRFSIKVANYLRKSWNIISLNYGSNILSTTPTLMAGDFNSSNTIDISDIGMILSVYNTLNVPVNSGNQKYDVDANETINISDIAIVLSNYTALVVRGDEI